MRMQNPSLFCTQHLSQWWWQWLVNAGHSASQLFSKYISNLKISSQRNWQLRGDPKQSSIKRKKYVQLWQRLHWLPHDTRPLPSKCPGVKYVYLCKYLCKLLTQYMSLYIMKLSVYEGSPRKLVQILAWRQTKRQPLPPMAWSHISSFEGCY